MLNKYIFSRKKRIITGAFSNCKCEHWDKEQHKTYNGPLLYFHLTCLGALASLIINTSKSNYRLMSNVRD